MELVVKVTFDRSVLGVSRQQNPFYGEIVDLRLRRRRLIENNKISKSFPRIFPFTLNERILNMLKDYDKNFGKNHIHIQ